MLWHERGGRGKRLHLLLHGLGATGAVWRGVCGEIDRSNAGEWIVVDLPGHGQSPLLPQYSIGSLAASVAECLDRDRPIRVIGHSLGVYVGLALASGWFGIQLDGLVGVGPKVTWTDAEVTAMHDLARKPARIFAEEAEAWSRYRKVSGLDVRVAPDTALLARGVMSAEGGYRLAADPRTPLVSGAPFATLAAAARCPILLARGTEDPMMTLDELQPLCPAALDIPGTGHNAHVEAPATIAGLSLRLSAADV
jgi:pimeloyl-ACP methyl ester carboxylesterase